MTDRSRPARPNFSFALVGLALASLWTGCASGGAPSIYTVRRELELQVPSARFEPETQISLGRVSLGLAKKILHWVADEEDEADLQLVFALKKVEVGVYQVHLSTAEQRALTLPARFERALTRSGWQTLARARKDGENTWVFLRPEGPDGEILRSLYVVTYDGDELVLVHVEGRLDQMLRTLAEEDPEGVAQVLIDGFG